MNNEPLKIGDKFIRKSKYGYVRGIVADINYDSYIVSEGIFTYFNPILTSENGIKYDLNECYKLLSVKTEEESELFEERIKRLYQYLHCGR